MGERAVMLQHSTDTNEGQATCANIGETMNDWVSVQEADFNFSTMSNRIAIGPQAEVIERLNTLNTKWGTDFTVTKTFRWSPGVYDKIKELMMKEFLGWHKRSNSVYSFFNKIDNNYHLKKTIGRDLNAIDSILLLFLMDYINLKILNMIRYMQKF